MLPQANFTGCEVVKKRILFLFFHKKTLFFFFFFNNAAEAETLFNLPCQPEPPVLTPDHINYQLSCE